MPPGAGANAAIPLDTVLVSAHGEPVGSSTPPGSTADAELPLNPAVCQQNPPGSNVNPITPGYVFPFAPKLTPSTGQPGANSPPGVTCCTTKPIELRVRPWARTITSPEGRSTIHAPPLPS